MIVEPSPGPRKRHDRPSYPAQGGRTRRGRIGHTIRAACVVLALGATAARAETIVDAAQRSVSVPAGIKLVVPTGAPAQVLLQALAPSLLGGLVDPFAPAHAIYVDPAIAALQQIPRLTRSDAPGDVKEVAALKPGLVVDYGNVSARFVAADEKIQMELGVPTVLFGGAIDAIPYTVTTLGGALGVGARGAALAKLTTTILDHAAPVSGLAAAERVPVYLARGQDGLTAARAGTSFDEVIRLSGGRNVVAGGGGTFRRLTVAEVVALNPSVVIVGESAALISPLRAALPKTVRFVLDEGEPYKALVGPPSLNRLVGLAALPAILHPDKIAADADLTTRTAATLFPLPAGFVAPTPLQVQP